jgi:hypothetical protein
VQGDVLLHRFAAAVRDQLPDVTELGLDHRALVLLLFLFLLLALLVLVLLGLLVDVQLVLHLLQHVDQQLGRGHPVVAHVQAALELHRDVDVGGQVVGLEAIEELGHGVLVEPGGDLVAGLVVATREFRARLLQQLLQRLQLVVIQSLGQRRDLDFGHAPYGAVP